MIPRHRATPVLEPRKLFTSLGRHSVYLVGRLFLQRHTHTKEPTMTTTTSAMFPPFELRDGESLALTARLKWVVKREGVVVAGSCWCGALTRNPPLAGGLLWRCEEHAR